MERQILIPHEVAPRLRCTRRQIYDLFGEGELAGFRVGSHIKIFADSVDDYISRHSNARPAANAPPGGCRVAAGVAQRQAAGPSSGFPVVSSESGAATTTAGGLLLPAASPGIAGRCRKWPMKVPNSEDRWL